MEYKIAGQDDTWTACETAGGILLARGPRQHTATVANAGSPMLVLVDGRPQEVVLGRQHVVVNGKVMQGSDTRDQSATSASGPGGTQIETVKSPMPGRLLQLCVKPGETVSAGDAVAVIEAMKMENELSAPCSGVVTEVMAAQGDAVEQGAELVRIDPKGIPKA